MKSANNVFNCKYKIKGDSNTYSYFELVETYKNHELAAKASDIFYSINEFLEKQRDAIKTIKKDFIALRSNKQIVVDGSPVLRNDDLISPQEFIDSPAFEIDGVRQIPAINLEDYIKEETARIVKENNISEEEALNLVEKQVEHWSTIAEDGAALHKILVDFHIASSKTTNDEIKAKVNLFGSSRLKNNTPLAISLYRSAGIRYRDAAGQYPNHLTLIGFNVTAALKGLDKELSCHIDYAFISSNGTLHIYNYKVSTLKSKDWGNVKRRKWKMEAALIRKALEQNNIYVGNLTYSIIPIHIQYNEDFSQITDMTVEKPVSLTTDPRTTEYTLGSYDTIASRFIEVTKPVQVTTSDAVQHADEIILHIFPVLNIHSNGIKKSAELWIRHAPDAGHVPLIIKEIGEPDHAFDVILNGRKYVIKDPKTKNLNLEIRLVVEEHLSELADNIGYTTNNLKEALEESLQKGFPTFESKTGLAHSSIYLSKLFGPYITKDSPWKVLSDGIDSNVFLMYNTLTNLIDVISLSPYNLTEQVSFRNGLKNLLGAYLYDIDQNMLTGDYGNVEVTRALVLLNELIPNIKASNIKLGKVIVANQMGLSRNYSILYIVKNFMPSIFSVVRKFDIKVNNNFSRVDFINEVDDILSYVQGIILENSSEQDTYDNLGFDELRNAEGRDAKRQALHSVLQRLQSQYFAYDSLKDIADLANNAAASGNIRSMARLYVMVSLAYHNLSDELLSILKELSGIDYYIYTAPTVPDANIRIVVNNLQVTIDSIAGEVMEQYEKNLLSFIKQFYKEVGYTPAENAVLGDQVRVYENLYERDELGNILMTFRNPYLASDNGSKPLNEAERKFLKKALFEFYRIRTKGNVNYTNENDPKLIADLKSGKMNDYFWVPLQRASNASTRAKFSRIKNAFKNIAKVITHPSLWFQEFVENISESEKAILEEDLSRMHLRNKFILGANERAAFISEKGVDYFETNIENLLVDYLTKAVEVEKFNDFLVGTKSLMLQMLIMGDLSGNSKIVKKELDYISDYLKVNVFKRSAMSKTGLMIIGALMPIRQAVTHANLAGNLVSYFRDTWNGYYENFMRTLTKFLTDLTAANVAFGYDYVITHGITNAMNVSLLSKLCARYRLSNTDLSRIGERLKSGRSGLLNMENWAYATLRSPDFVNRMVLFVARCKLDGVWDAFKIDENDNLVYNWKKDKRFNLLASNDKSNLSEYNKQRALYISKIREWNKEHPDALLSYEDDLPAPYSDLEIVAIKNVANNIYGSYDRSLRSMSENMAIGVVFGMYTTWMNGMWNNYMLKPGQYNTELQDVQETDEVGNPLWLDKQGNITTDEKEADLPIMKKVGVITLGIHSTLKNMLHTFMDADDNQGFKALKEYLLAHPRELANLRKLTYDSLLGLLFLMLFKLAIDPAYKEYKVKDMKDNPVLTNLMTEIMYKSTSRAYDSFLGPANIVLFFGENMNPPIYTVPVSIMKDTGEFIFGEKTFGLVVTKNFGIARAYHDTYNAAIKK